MNKLKEMKKMLESKIEQRKLELYKLMSYLDKRHNKKTSFRSQKIHRNNIFKR